MRSIGHTDPDIPDLVERKGTSNGERELHNVYDNAWKQGTIVKIGGVEMRLVDLDGLNERFAILEATWQSQRLCQPS